MCWLGMPKGHVHCEGMGVHFKSPRAHLRYEQTERQTDRQTGKQTDRKTGTETETGTETDAERQTTRQTDKQKDRWKIMIQQLWGNQCV